LRNHGFLLSNKGWSLSPAYDLNPVPAGTGLRLNISETDNALNPDLALEVAPLFRLSKAKAEEIVKKVKAVAGKWAVEAKALGISKSQMDLMASAFSNF
jgi:serine/threonine-protein kinase HipA